MSRRRTLQWSAAVLFLAVALCLPMLRSLLGRTIMDQVMAEQGDRAQAAAKRVKPKLERDLHTLGLEFGAPIFMRIFKREKELELWVESDAHRFVLFRTYPICTYSGDLGPKQREGDNQAPEGFYRVTTAQLNPKSQFHLSFNLGYPNAYDRANSRTGNFLMVHGACVSIGCYAMGDDGIEEIYTIAAAALKNGQPSFEVHAFPFRLDKDALEREKNSIWHAFWSELKPAYDSFEHTRRPPLIQVRDRHYSITES